MILDEIVAHKHHEVAAAKARISEADLRAHIADMEEPTRGFARALKDSRASGWTTIIAEVKKGSPSKGVIRPDFDPLAIAETYAAGGAACLSVLTDERFFLGHLLPGIIRELCGCRCCGDFARDPIRSSRHATPAPTPSC
jgi:indole-3-glycerol phosphate synthase